jgi:hypothetical protein
VKVVALVRTPFTNPIFISQQLRYNFAIANGVGEIVWLHRYYPYTYLPTNRTI